MIYLPAFAGPPLGAPAEAETGAQPGGGRILLMDDEELIRNLSRNVLSRLGYEAECVSDGAEAVALYRDAVKSGRPFRAVLLDLTVRAGMGGVEALKQIREIDPRVKAIVSSGYSEDPVMAHFREYGFQGVISKPWTIHALGEALKRVLDQ